MYRNFRVAVVALAVGLLPCVGAQQAGTSVSPRDQLQQYVTQLQASPTDDALRTKIIQLALALDPKPANPPDLPETIGAATYAFKNAQSDTDMINAANLYAKAALESPWRADLYFNEALALERAKHLDEAINAYRFYLLAAPDASDTDSVREKIGALKYQLSQQQVASDAEQARRNAEAQAEREREFEARQRLAAYPMEGLWSMPYTSAPLRLWNNGSGWSAQLQGGNVEGEFVVQSVAGSHITLTQTVSRSFPCFPGAVKRWELDLSSNGEYLIGKRQVPSANCETWDRGNHRMEWDDVQFKRIQ